VTPELHRRAQEILGEALEQPIGSRAAFVERACAGDAELAREVQSLLATFGGVPENFLQRPAAELVGGSATAGPAVAAGRAFEEGTRLGPYEIVDRVGAGGMGEVYRARDPRLGREVAIKVLPGSFSADPSRLRRFEQEARAAGGLNHPNITTVYDVGSENGAPYVVFELLEGQSLRDRLGEGPLSQRRAIEYGRQIARGLGAAHEKGIVHRDLKPENLFLTRDGRIRILDFGLAKLTSPGASLEAPSGSTTALQTDAGMVLGTVGYMSPEQVRGQSVDQRSDIFSFGSILYEMLTGRRAFQRSSSVETMSAILKEEPEELQAEGGSFPPPIERIVRHCLEKERDQRFQSATDLAFALESLSGSSQEVLRRPSASSFVAKGAGSSRNRHFVASLAGIAAIGVVLGVLLRPRPPEEPPFVRSLTYSGHDYSPAASPDAHMVAFVSDRDGTARIWIKELAGGGEAAITQGPDDFPRFSPDGSTILFSRQEGPHASLFRVPVLGGEPRKLVEDAVDGDWSPDGRLIVFVRLIGRQGLTDTSLRVANENGGEERELARWKNQTLLHPRWSPDGSTIAAAESGFQQPGQPRQIFLTGVRGGPPRSIPPPAATNRLSSVAWSGPGELIYSQALSDAAVVSQAPARLVRQSLRSGEIRTLLWSPSGSEILDILGPGRLVFDASSTRENLRETPRQEGATPRWLTRGNSSDRQPSYSADGRRVVFSSNRSGRWNLWEVARSTGSVRRLTEGDETDWDPGFTPDGAHLLWSSNRAGHYEVWMAAADGSGPRQVTNDGVDAENPTETPDGEWIVYSSSNPAKPGIWKIHPDGSGASRLVAGLFAHPEVSPNGEYVVFQTVFVPEGVSIRVVRVADGAAVPFEIRIQGNQLIGRSRWLPGSRGIAFVGQGDGDVTGVYAQDVVPGRDTSSTRRRLAGFDSEFPTESFGLSSDGSAITVAVWEQLLGIMTAEGVTGVSRSEGKAR
jgi:serine/threonine protein kinase/Tol biopolymer transport system component